MAGVAPLISGPRALEKADRSELVNLYQHYRGMSNEWLRRAILQNNRIDILATAILGYQVQPFHLRMLQWEFQHPDSMTLAFRGAGKTTTCTVTKAVFYLCKSRDFRLLLASKTTRNAQGFLKEIKGHLEENTRLIEVFGEFYDPQKVYKWDLGEIEVLGRTRRAKEGSITCVGVDSTVVSKHYDAILSDDLVDETNTKTKHIRDQTRRWYYNTLDPVLEPPDPTVPHRGEHHRKGTRYHYDDLYGHLEENELKEHTLIIPALDIKGQSPWPEKYPPKWFKAKKKKAGTIIFNAQFQCNTEAMKGEVFRFDDCQVVTDADIPSGLRKFLGVDLAISDEDQACQFAIVAIGKDKVTGKYYVLEYFAEVGVRFSRQTKLILDFWRRYDPIRIGIETNGYQRAQLHNLKDKDKEIRFRKVNQQKEDKMTRAWKLSALFEDGKMNFREGSGTGEMVDQLVMFPSHPFKDLFDALDLAVKASRMRTRRQRQRRREPGLI